MCPYVCCGRRAMRRRRACDRDIERCECANDHACVTCDRVRDGRIKRDGCYVTDAPLSLSHTHKYK